MLKYNLLLIYRSFKRNRSTFFINIIGLSTGLACVLMIYLWVNDELNFDLFNEKDSQLFQVMSNHHNTDGITTGECTPDLLAETMALEIPEIEYAVAVIPAPMLGKIPLSANDKHIKGFGEFAGKDYFNIFSYHLIQGSKNQVLLDKNSVVISEKLAKNLFNTTENVIGKTIEWQLLNIKQKAFVSGVFKEVPVNSSDQFDFVLSFEAWKDFSKMINRPINWDNHDPSTYLILKEGTSVSDFNKKIEGYIKSKFIKSNVTLFITPFSKKYLYGIYQNGVQSGGRIEYVKLFSIIAFFILIIACINFMNLSTAKASRRIKDIGIKKAVGVRRSSLILQFMSESLLMTFSSLLIAVLIVALLLPQFNNISGKHLSLNFNMQIILSLLIIGLFTAIISGSYPALYLSRFKPASILKGKLSNSMNELWARKGLVVFQFVLSVILIVSVVVVYKQIEFIQRKNLGYSKDNVICFDSEGKVSENMDAFLAEVKNIPGVVNATSVAEDITENGSFTLGVRWEGKKPDELIRFANITVNYDMVETLGIGMSEGRTFSRNYGSDKSKIIFNEAAIKVMGINNPIGKIVNLWGENKQIIGVTKNFHFQSLYKPIRPMLLRLAPENTRIIMVKIRAGMGDETINNLKQFYQKYNPGFSLDYRFLDDDYQAQYVAEKRIAVLSRYFAGLAILISCLGLFGLAAFTVERRFKEIGIRRTLGLNKFGIFWLITSDFTKIVIIAIVIAIPLSYFIVLHWLDKFAFKISLEWWFFIGAGFISLLVAWITTGMQAIKAAKIEPANCLRDE